MSGNDYTFGVHVLQKYIDKSLCTEMTKPVAAYCTQCPGSYVYCSTSDTTISLYTTASMFVYSFTTLEMTGMDHKVGLFVE
jgi:hypothetical protein